MTKFDILLKIFDDLQSQSEVESLAERDTDGGEKADGGNRKVDPFAAPLPSRPRFG